MTKPVVHFVHCIDTEGPLHEPLWATFDRVYEIFGVRLEANQANLEKIRRKEIDFGGHEDLAAEVFSERKLAYNNTWDKVLPMLRRIMAPEFRDRFKDSFGNGWVYNWFCLDVVGVDYNLRHRDVGYHNIFDHYREIIAETGSHQDGLHFHHHPVSFSHAAHLYSTHYFSHTPVVFEVLARRIIERNWFPCANRPGYNVERPDSHWLFEQFIPFDFANQATVEDYSMNKDLSAGRLGDWRRAPLSWAPYHPHHDDYQIEGSCRRWISRCLSVGSRARNATADDVNLAFREAREGKPVVLSFTNHDYRDMVPEIEEMAALIEKARADNPDVDVRFCEARDAMRSALELEVADQPLSFDVSWDGNRLHIAADRDIFGPQPFFALKTWDGRFFHDNLDFQRPFREWTYTFDEHSVPLKALEAIGIGACDPTGSSNATVVHLDTGDITQTRR